MRKPNHYNGWQNYLTWLTNLYFGDYVDELLYNDVEIAALVDDDANFEEVYDIIERELELEVQHALGMPPFGANNFLHDVLHNAVLQEICFDQIALFYVKDAFEYRARVKNDENLPQ